MFDCSTDNISLHLKNIFREEELDEKSTTEFFSVVQKEGNRNVSRNVKCYNLDAIIAVGYRVNSKNVTRFRQWATKTLKEYIIKGFVLNDDMLKNGKPFGKDYFDCVRGEQAGTPKKPAPDGALIVCRELGMQPGDCLYLGDTNTDMKTGIAAGMDTVGVTWGFRDREELVALSPQYIVDYPSQVELIIEKADTGNEDLQ